MRPGFEIEVRSRFDGRWVGGFAVDEVIGTGAARQVWVRRLSDGCRLPVPFPMSEVRQRVLSATAR